MEENIQTTPSQPPVQGVPSEQVAPPSEPKKSKPIFRKIFIALAVCFFIIILFIGYNVATLILGLRDVDDNMLPKLSPAPAHETTNSNPNNISNWKTYSNSNLKADFKYPGDWVIYSEEFFPPEEFLVILEKSGNKISISRNFGGRDFDPAIVENVTLNGYDARKATKQSQSIIEEITYFQIIVDRDWYTITFVAAEDKTNNLKYVNEFNAIANSITVN